MEMASSSPRRDSLKSQKQARWQPTWSPLHVHLGLERALAREGISLARANVGDRYVLEEMLRTGSVSAASNPATSSFSTTLLPAMVFSPPQKSLRSFPCMAASSLSLTVSSYPQVILNVKVRSNPRSTLSPKSRALASPLPWRNAASSCVFRHRATRSRHGRSRARCRRPALSQSLAALRSSIGACLSFLPKNVDVAL